MKQNCKPRHLADGRYLTSKQCPDCPLRSRAPKALQPRRRPR